MRFDEAREQLPTPRLVEAAPGLRLDTLYVDGDPPCVVFLHGGLGNLWDPYPQLVHLAGSREVVSYSFAGNGNSDDRPDHALSEHVGDLSRLLDTLNITRPFLVGWSYGTAVALEYAKLYPVNGLFLIDGGSHELTPPAEYPVLKAVLALRLHAVRPPSWLLRRFAKWLGFHPDTPMWVVDEMLKANPWPTRRSAWKMVIEALWGYDGRQGPGAIRVPALVAHGPADQVVPIEVARETAHLLPNGQFIAVEQTGHASPVERPGAYNWLVDRLIAASQRPESWPLDIGSSLPPGFPVGEFS